MRVNIYEWQVVQRAWAAPTLTSAFYVPVAGLQGVVNMAAVALESMDLWICMVEPVMPTSLIAS